MSCSKREKAISLPSGTPRTSSGLSLIELMIATVLGLILTLGVVQVYIGSSQTYTLTDAIAHAQENLRFVTTIIERDVRGAGGLACLQSAEDIDVKMNGDPPVPIGSGLLGWEFQNTGVGDEHTPESELGTGSAGWSEGSGDGTFPSELEGFVVAGSDILIVNALRSIPVTVTGSSTGSITLDSASEIPQGRIVLAVDDNCSGGEMFQKANNETAQSLTMAGVGANPGNQPSSGFDLTYGSNARIAAHDTFAYYIGIGTSGEPSLMRRRLGAEPEAAEELVEGVETVQILYGISTGVRKRADTYITAADVNDWDQVVSVRLSFLVRSPEDANNDNQVRRFNMLGTELVTENDRRARLMSTITVGIRNRLE
jgi:type IV pilus assembly protein PilW